MLRDGVDGSIHFTVYDIANNVFLADTVGNLAIKLIIDGVVSDPTNTVESIGGGGFRILLTAAEKSGAKLIYVHGKSSTPNAVVIMGIAITDLFISGSAFVACYMGWNTGTNAPETGDATNHSMLIAQDNTSSVATGQSEVDAVHLPGLYKVSGTVAQGTGSAVTVLGASSTPNVNLMPVYLSPYTVDYPVVGDVRDGTIYADATLTGTLETTIKGPAKVIKLDTGAKVIKL